MLDDVIAITNRKLCQIPFREQIKRVCEIKPKAIILREKDISKKGESPCHACRLYHPNDHNNLSGHE